MIRINREAILRTSLVLMVMFFCACTQGRKSNEGKSNSSGNTLELKYATGFNVEYCGAYKKVTVYNPWEQDAIFATYYLVPHDSVSTPLDGLKLHIPLQSVSTSSSTQIEPLRLIDELGKVSGICTPELIYNEEIGTRHQCGDIVNLGDAMSVNVEKTLQLKPDAVFMSGYSSSNNFTEHLQKASVPIVYNNEWMEKILLARAEWIKFMAVFFDKEKQADSIFAEIDTRYQTLKHKVSNTQHKPSVMTGGNFRGTWYVPAGDNYMARLFVDAGGDYLYANDERSGSIPLTVEKVVYEFADAVVWVGSAANSLQELAQMDNKHTYFKSYKSKSVYNFNKRSNAMGANDFWEKGVSRPDLILADMIKILYPELMPDYEFVFVNRLE